MYYSFVLQAEAKAEEAEKRLAVAEKMFSAQSNDVMAKHVSDFIGFCLNNLVYCRFVIFRVLSFTNTNCTKVQIELQHIHQCIRELW